MKYSILILAFLALVSCNSQAQNKSMENQVKTALKEYLEAGDKNDAKALEEHLHNDFRVVLYDGTKDAVSILDKKTYLSFIETKKFGGYPRTADYHTILSTGNHMVTAQVTLTSPGKPTLKNFYSLAKVGGKWKVIQDYVTIVPTK